MSNYKNKFLYQILFLMMTLIFNEIVFAQTKQTFSCATKNIKTNGNFIILNDQYKSSQSKIFFIKNISKKGIWIGRKESNNASANAGWNSYLKPRHWSALMVSQPRFVMNCSMINPGKIKYLHCASVIQVCESNLKTNSKQGNYWYVENKKWDEFIREVINKTSRH